MSKVRVIIAELEGAEETVQAALRGLLTQFTGGGRRSGIAAS